PTECIWHYYPCHRPCYKTCLNPEGVCFNPIPTLEGCYPVCPEDKPIFDEENQTCVDVCPEPNTTTPPTTTTTMTQPTSTTTPPTTTTTTPTTTTTTTISTTTMSLTSCIPEFKCEWSDWYDVHDPTDKSDWETYKNITDTGLQICNNIEAK
uniref:VWFC domain-containing protein n=1 Tax=Oreochromis aureus TaxID=47969 RepID=A0AAZ1X0F7_OREAU